MFWIRDVSSVSNVCFIPKADIGQANSKLRHSRLPKVEIRVTIAIIKSLQNEPRFSCRICRLYERSPQRQDIMKIVPKGMRAFLARLGFGLDLVLVGALILLCWVGVFWTLWDWLF